MKNHLKKKLELFFEFLIFGVIMGIAEDLIAIRITTDAVFDLRIIWVVTLITIPFAIFGELIVDKKDEIAKFFKQLFTSEENKKSQN